MCFGWVEMKNLAWLVNRFWDILALGLASAFFYGAAYGFGRNFKIIANENGGIFFLGIAVIYFVCFWRVYAWVKRIRDSVVVVGPNFRERGAAIGVACAAMVIVLVGLAHFIVLKM